MNAVALEHAFEAHRRELWAIVYRMTGSAADADDVLQETFARALERPPPRLDLPLRPWLVRVAVNRARDLLRARRRTSYVGPWLPGPVELDGAEPPAHEPALPGGESAEGRYDLLESVSFAFLLALEALSPVQRAVLLLRDVFDYSVAETAEALDLSEANAKQIHLRARRRMVEYDAKRVSPSAELRAETARVLGELVQRIVAQDVPGIEALLARDVRSLNDGAGRYLAATRPVHGPARVARFLAGITRKRGPVDNVEMRMLNGTPAIVVRFGDLHRRAAPRAVFMIELDRAGLVASVYNVLADRKLAGVS